MKDNEVIAEFMGLRSVYDYPTGYSKWVADDKTFRVLMYHESWDWLMPVVEKIESLGYGFHKSPFDLDIIEYISGLETKVIAFQDDPEMKLIDKWYYVVVKFIEWYNTKKTL